MSAQTFHAIDGLDLAPEHRALLQPGEAKQDSHGNVHYLPRFFYEIASWDEARDIRLTAHFTVAELMMVDCREADVLLREFPHYVPCAILLLARFLEDFRREVDGPVFVSANGGYRSPAHQIWEGTSVHAWAAAADIYRIGDTFLDDAKSIERYGAIAASLSPAVFVRPFGSGLAETDDHLHLDIGFVTFTPRECSEVH